MRPAVKVEICVGDVASAIAAEAGGADRIELCDNLAVGGTTPSAGTIAESCRRLSIPVHVLIRPRGGDFIYSEPEIAVMRHDIETAKALGAAGVVLGVLTADGAIDRDQTAALIALARPLSVTFHKAFDQTAEPLEALETLIDLGVERVLTSGGRPTALEGIETLGAPGRSRRRPDRHHGRRPLEHGQPRKRHPAKPVSARFTSARPRAERSRVPWPANS